MMEIRIKLALFSFLAFLVWCPLHSQVTIREISIKSNKQLSDSVFKRLAQPNDQAVFYFCPLSESKAEEYRREAEKAYLNTSKFNNVNNLTIVLIYFLENPGNPSDNPPIVHLKDTLEYMYHFDCIVYNVDSLLLKRAIKVASQELNVARRIALEKIAYIIHDKGVCFTNLPARIPAYSNLVKEIFDPQYTHAESIEMLKDSISVLNLSVSNLKKEFNDAIIRLEKLVVELQDQSKNQISPNQQPKSKFNGGRNK